MNYCWDGHYLSPARPHVLSQAGGWPSGRRTWVKLLNICSAGGCWMWRFDSCGWLDLTVLDWLTVCITAVGAECSVWELWARSELSWEKFLVWSTEWSSGLASWAQWHSRTNASDIYIVPQVKLISIIARVILKKRRSISSLVLLRWMSILLTRQQLRNNERSCKCKVTTHSLVQSTGHAESGGDLRRLEERIGGEGRAS